MVCIPACNGPGSGSCVSHNAMGQGGGVYLTMQTGGTYPTVMHPSRKCLCFILHNLMAQIVILWLLIFKSLHQYMHLFKLPLIVKFDERGSSEI